MKHGSILCRSGAHIALQSWIGTLCFTVAPVLDFSSSGRRQNILEQFPSPHRANLSPGTFTTPPDLFPTPKKSGSLEPAPEPPELTSVLDLDYTFREPDEIVKPEPFIRRAFRNLEKKLRLVIQRPVRYIRHIKVELMTESQRRE
jgi:hypothetical protein